MKKGLFLFIPTIFVISFSGCGFKLPDDTSKQLVLSGDYRTEFTVGDYFKTDGLVVTCNDEIINDYQISPFIYGNRLIDAGTFTVTISKENYLSASYDIVVNAENELFISSLPSLTTYTEGDLFSSDGLAIVDQLGNPVTDYTLSIEEGTELKVVGQTTVYVTKQDYISKSFTITVNEYSGGETTYKDLTIYYVNDTHGSFSKMSKYYEPGMSAVSHYIKSSIAATDHYSLILSGGDMFQGGYESNESRGYVMADAMNIIGFDAMAVGNHEFDWGEEAVINLSNKLEFPMLSSNIFYKSNNQRPEWLSPYTIITKDDLKIGIIGGAQYNLGNSIDGQISQDFLFPEPNSYIKSYSTELRLNHGCDIILALFHDEGYDTDKSETQPTKFNDLTQVDPNTGLKYVDAMFFSHDHYEKHGIYNGVPYIESQCNGRYVGEITLSLVGNGVSYSVNDASYINNDLRYYSGSDADIDNILNKPEYAAISVAASEVIYNFSYSYEKADFTEVACMAMYWFVNSHKNEFGNETIYFASHNTGGVRAKVFSGAFTMKEFVKVFPFDNKLVIQTCNSNNIDYMASSSYYRTYQSGDIVYSGGYTKAVTITYISEYRVKPDGSNNCQVSRIIYDNYTAKDALLAYLKEGINPNL